MPNALYLPLLAEQVPTVSGANAILFLGLAIFFGVVLSGAYAFSVVWAAMDAANRGKSWLLVALLVALVVWPVGLVLWLALRPEPSSPNAFPGSVERK